MNQLVSGISEKLGLPTETVAKAIAAILNFVKDKSQGTEFESLLKALPGADELMSQGASTAGEGGQVVGGLLGGLFEKAGAFLGGDAGDLAGVMSGLQKSGVPMDKMAPLVTEFLAQAEKLAGPEAVESAVSSIPGLKDLLPKGSAGA